MFPQISYFTYLKTSNLTWQTPSICPEDFVKLWFQGPGVKFMTQWNYPLDQKHLATPPFRGERTLSHPTQLPYFMNGKTESQRAAEVCLRPTLDLVPKPGFLDLFSWIIEWWEEGNMSNNLLSVWAGPGRKGLSFLHVKAEVCSDALSSHMSRMEKPLLVTG